MNPIIPTIDIEGVRISSSLFLGSNPQYLTQDLLTVALPSGYVVDVGWTPEHDPSGNYVINVFYEFPDDPAMHPIFVRDMMDMLSAVTTLCYRWSSPQVSSTETVAL